MNLASGFKEEDQSANVPRGSPHFQSKKEKKSHQFKQHSPFHKRLLICKKEFTILARTPQKGIRRSKTRSDNLGRVVSLCSVYKTDRTILAGIILKKSQTIQKNTIWLLVWKKRTIYVYKKVVQFSQGFLKKDQMIQNKIRQLEAYLCV